ncbi:hypothetical protein GCM10020001_018960 [Nonomuraea salmonea]
MIEVVAPGPYATVQDLGRPGFAHLGVPCSGAADAPALKLANRLVGNAEWLAGVELTFGGARLRFADAAWVAVTGAPLEVRTAGASGVRPGMGGAVLGARRSRAELRDARDRAAYVRGGARRHRGRAGARQQVDRLAVRARAPRRCGPATRCRSARPTD